MILLATLTALSATMAGAQAGRPVSRPEVALLRVPQAGLQPRAAVDSEGALHLVYFVGDPAGGDLRYARAGGLGESLGDPLPVNRLAKSAVAVGNVRGAQIALGERGRVHVVWNGVEPQVRGSTMHPVSPLLYTRLDDAGTAFEPERDVITSHHGLDGGGAVAADASGNVYVVWHAPDERGEGEEARRVWVARSSDGGQTFSAERPASEPGSGVCPCCALGAIALDGGGLAILYRTAREGVNRDTVLLRSGGPLAEFEATLLDPWKVPACVMSTFSLARGSGGVVGAWETEGRIRFGVLARERGIGSASGGEEGRKHPSIACNPSGDVLVAWIESMSWGGAGALGWEVFDPAGNPIEGLGGRRDGVPAWSLVQALAWPDGRFAIVY